MVEGQGARESGPGGSTRPAREKQNRRMLTYASFDLFDIDLATRDTLAHVLAHWNLVGGRRGGKGANKGGGGTGEPESALSASHSTRRSRK